MENSIVIKYDWNHSLTLAKKVFALPDVMCFFIVLLITILIYSIPFRYSFDTNIMLLQNSSLGLGHGKEPREISY